MKAFKFMVLQICAWSLFPTFWGLFAAFPNFSWWVYEMFPFEEKNEPYEEMHYPFEAIEEQSPTTDMYDLLLWVFVLAPTSSVLYLLLYPRCTLRGFGLKFEHESPVMQSLVSGLWKIMHPLLKFLYPMAFLLFPCMTYLYTSGLRRPAIIWSGMLGCYFALCLLFSLIPSHWLLDLGQEDAQASKARVVEVREAVTRWLWPSQWANSPFWRRYPRAMGAGLAEPPVELTDNGVP